MFINPDLTHEQRAEQKRLNDERKLRKANGEDVIIQNGKVILCPAPMHPRHQSTTASSPSLPQRDLLSFKCFIARSIKNKLHELGILSSANFDFIAITETWLNDDFPNSAISAHLPNYSIYRSDRVDCRAGGALILTSPLLHVESLPSINVNNMNLCGVN